MTVEEVRVIVISKIEDGESWWMKIEGKLMIRDKRKGNYRKWDGREWKVKKENEMKWNERRCKGKEEV